MTPSIARMLDANFNRAREALRVMEDCARFDLDDRLLVDRTKRLRHELAEAIRAHHLEDVVRARDILGDVGREAQTDAEYERPDLRSVTVAAGKRLTEALRVIEEAGKTFDARFARAVEQIRYRAYEIERQLGIRFQARQRFGQVRLYVLITESLCRADWLDTARAALAGGADCLQLREKNLPDAVLVERGRQLAAMCREAGALCIINDRPDVAVAAGADGVHVGQEDLSIADARRVVGPDRLVGVSTHTLEQFEAAAAQSPDYIAVGPMFATGTKPQHHIPGPELLPEALTRTSLPVVAIGGITADNVQAVTETGCNCVCVCQAVVSQADPAVSARNMRAVGGRSQGERISPGGAAVSSQGRKPLGTDAGSPGSPGRATG
ncbi:MAG: thiamine phosphate synthase [Planctomycetes bacterium]|nr:thiamine phosphate synthase [Planctomycetota bacterium]